NVIPFSQIVYARVINTMTGCYAIVDLELRTIEIPQITQLNNLFIDEGDGDGIAVFDLTVNIPIMLAGLDPTDYLVWFYLTQADAENNIDPITSLYTNISNPQTIYVRVEEINTSCFVVTSFEIETDQFDPLADEDNDGITNAEEDLN